MNHESAIPTTPASERLAPQTAMLMADLGPAIDDGHLHGLALAAALPVAVAANLASAAEHLGVERADPALTALGRRGGRILEQLHDAAMLRWGGSEQSSWVLLDGTARQLGELWTLDSEDAATFLAAEERRYAHYTARVDAADITVLASAYADDPAFLTRWSNCPDPPVHPEPPFDLAYDAAEFAQLGAARAASHLGSPDMAVHPRDAQVWNVALLETVLTVAFALGRALEKRTGDNNWRCFEDEVGTIAEPVLGPRPW